MNTAEKLNTDTVITLDTLPMLGAPVAGGFFAGVIQMPTCKVGIVVSPKALGERTGKWLPEYRSVADAHHVGDGARNTVAMAEAGSEIAKWAQHLTINGFMDWYVPARDELELIYRNLKPGDDENLCGFRDGDNPSSVPPGLPYQDESPAQTTVEAFRTDGDEALDETYHWNSTQYSANTAFVQDFSDGTQRYGSMCNTWRVRAVRRFLIN